MKLFTLQCTTCRASLVVRNKAAIGQILACPKCESMVHIVPPPGWQADLPAEKPSEPSRPTAASPAVPSPASSPAVRASFELPDMGVRPTSSPTPPPIAVGTNLRPNWSSPVEQRTRKYVLYGSALTLATALVVGLGLAWMGGDESPEVVVNSESSSEREQEDPGEVDPNLESGTPADKIPEVVPALPSDEAPAPDASPAPSEPAAEVLPPVEDLPEVVDEEPETQNDPLPAPQPPAEPEEKTPVPELPAKSAGAPAESEPELPAAPAEPEVVVAPPAKRHPPSPGDGPLDLEAALATPVREIEVREMTLAHLLDLLRDMTMLPITVDPYAVAASGSTLAAPVSLHKNDAPVAEILTGAITPLKLTYVVTDERISITSRNVGLQEARFRLDDLLLDAEHGEPLAELLQTFVAPNSWKRSGGVGEIEIRGTDFIVKQTAPVIYEAIVFCERLRVARGLPARSRLPEQRFRIETRAEQVGKVLSQPITFTFHQPTRFTEVVRYWEHATGLTILIDWESLTREAFTPGVEVSCAADGVPLAQALGEVLGALELSWRIIDARTLQVFSAQDELSKMQCEFYPVRDLLEGGQDASVLMATLRQGAAAQWQARGAAAAIEFDPASKSLIVLQSQAGHAQVAQALGAIKHRLAAGQGR